METTQILQYTMLPLICALIGWGTNYLAIKMLFHPRRPWKLGLFTVQGVFPRRQKALARRLGEMIENNLISHEDVTGIIEDPEFASRLDGVVEEYVDTFIREKLGTIHPMVGMFLNDSMIPKIKGLMMDHLRDLIPGLLGQAAYEIEDRLHFGEMVCRKIEDFSLDQLERMLFSIMSREFKFIELTGAVLGLIVGCFQIAVLHFL